MSGATSIESFPEHLRGQLRQLADAGLFKRERVIGSPQRTHLALEDGTALLNLCANNYLGLADAPELVAAAKEGLDRYGYGMASVRFICGTQTPHRRLEERLAAFLGTEDCILFSSCWDANGGVFECLLGEEDAVISDALNHASIIDGIRLCKAKRFRCANGDAVDLARQLEAADAAGARFKLVVTDGVFSMDGVIADLRAVRRVADAHGALLMVDDSHAVGFIGPNGRGTHEAQGLLGRVDVLTGTFGKALGGASGGYVAATRDLVALLRQRARPYLFSNSLMPAIAHATLAALELVERGDARRRQLVENAAFFRERLTALGFTLGGAGHPIVPVMLGDAALAARFAEAMLAEGVYVVGFSFPVVPQGRARIRTQLSAAHSRADLERAVAAFARVGRALGVLDAAGESRPRP